MSRWVPGWIIRSSVHTAYVGHHHRVARDPRQRVAEHRRVAVEGGHRQVEGHRRDAARVEPLADQVPAPAVVPAAVHEYGGGRVGQGTIRSFGQKAVAAAGRHRAGRGCR
jgi:hypothetical protein